MLETLVLGLVVLLASPAEAPRETTDDPDELARSGRSEQAAERYRRIAEGDPTDTASRAGRVRALLALQRWRDALDEGRRYAGELPDSPVVATALGEALFRAGRFRETDEVLSPVVARLRDPGDGAADARTLARALVTLGRLRTAEGRHGLAAGYLERAFELAPDDRWVVYWTAGAAPTRAGIVRRLERYLELSEGDDPDRIEAARGKIRFFGVLGERRVWVAENRPERVELPLTPLGDGAGRTIGYVVDVGIGPGKPVRLMLDSGSTGLFLVERIARKHGFEPLAEETVFGGGGDKRHPSPRGLFPSVSVAGVRFADALATTTRDEIEPTGRFHGFLGLSPLEDYCITLDLGRGRLVLDRTAPEAPEAGEPYWDVSGQMLVEASTSTGAGGLFLLDTGATSTTVSLDLAEHAPGVVLGDARDVRGYGGTLAGTRQARGLAVRFVDLPTAGTSVQATDLSVRSRLAGVEISGMIGLDLLAGRRIVVDTRTRRVSVLEPEPKSKRRRKQKRK